MYQIDNSTAVAVIPASTPAGSVGFFTDGNPVSNIPATILPAEFMNMLMMEMLGVLSAAGVAPSKAVFSQLTLAIRGLIQSGTALYALDTGSANVYTVAFSPIVTVPTDGTVLKFKAKTANTGASTFSPNGLTAKPLVGAAHSALQGGEIIAGSDVWVQWNSTVGTGSWVLIDSTGGALQVSPATQSQHAMQLGQATGRLLGAPQIFSAAGTFTYTPTAGTTSVVVEAQGAGGAGGGVTATASTTVAVAPGGTAGAYAKSRLTSGFAGASIVVGAKGLGVIGANGLAGGSSSFGAVLTAAGGSAGGLSASSAPPLIQINTTATAIASGGNIVNNSGQAGGYGHSIATTSGISGAGGSSVFGSGAAPVGMATGTASSGRASQAPGAAGSGATSTNSASSAAGGNGADGIVIIWEYT